VRSLLQPAVHLTIRARFWAAFGGTHTLFARLFDSDAADAVALRCALRHLVPSEPPAINPNANPNVNPNADADANITASNAFTNAFWSLPRASGKAVPAPRETAGCRFAPATQLARYPYMALSLARQLDTLASCYAALRREEARRGGVQFVSVLRTRTDTAFLLPARPLAAVEPASVHLARRFQKGDSGHHMFADHAAVVPRAAPARACLLRRRTRAARALRGARGGAARCLRRPRASSTMRCASRVCRYRARSGSRRSS
jgi:hypothetical protein